ncbi:MAG: hypothetical protein U1F43_21415 [Myxococcota bacterium]
MFRLVLIALGSALLASGCASSSEIRCKPSDNSIALCQMGSHEECEDLDNGCERCTCVPDRPTDLEHGPVAPE